MNPVTWSHTTQTTLAVTQALALAAAFCVRFAGPRTGSRFPLSSLKSLHTRPCCDTNTHHTPPINHTIVHILRDPVCQLCFCLLFGRGKHLRGWLSKWVFPWWVLFNPFCSAFGLPSYLIMFNLKISIFITALYFNSLFLKIVFIFIELFHIFTRYNHKFLFSWYGS